MKDSHTQVKDLIIPLTQYPHLNDDQTIDDAIQSFMEFRAGQKERLHYAIIFVLNNQSQLVGKLTLMDIMRAFAPRLFQGLDTGKFDGKKADFPDLALLHEEKIFSECGKSRMQQIKPFISPIEFTIPSETNMLTALLMMHSRKEFDVPVTENGSVIGVLRLEEVFTAMCNTYCLIPLKKEDNNE